ncbi:MAG: alpha-amylase family glycosyl hydrolase [Candidatus Omnitrophica bacterium]|nr:alpha-amylase family glycosyl hydrolase [Candidatus Omnitrophota bacterium]
MSHWADEAFFYHIYPLGLCGAPAANDLSSVPEPRLEKLYKWLDHISGLGANALYLGPVFESSTHGYDTVDYYRVDRRLGRDDTLKALVDGSHRRGIRVILDAVFNHTGRDFWAFKDLLAHGEGSAYRDWFCGVRFDKRSPYNDPFSYDGWNGHFNLVKLNLSNPAVREHLLKAVEKWIREYNIDGLRLDAADCIDLSFLKHLSSFCRSIRPDFWLLGEVIHGDYRKWVHEGGLDSVTNYECFKGLYSSHNDKNYFEIAYSYNREFAKNGMYEGIPLYNFTDNHDVNRLASLLKDSRHLYTTYGLLFTMPGVPSLYYGSEWGLEGAKVKGSDSLLRPCLELEQASFNAAHPELIGSIRRLASIRKSSRALCRGAYRQLIVNSEQFAFERRDGQESVVVVVNASAVPARVELPLQEAAGAELIDILNNNEAFRVSRRKTTELTVPPAWLRILKVCA